MNKTKTKTTPKKKLNAYVWLLFGGGRYLPGVLLSGYTVKRTKTKNHLVCLVTKDVNQYDISLLKKIFDKVITVDYIYGPNTLRTFKQKKLYNKWIEVSYTKWNALKLTEYEKIFFLDGDTLVTSKIDIVFQNSRPSGTFFNVWSKKYKKDSTINDHFVNKKIVRPKIIKKALTDSGFVATASSILLEPKKKYFNNFLKMLKDKKEIEVFAKDNYSGGDEQSIAWFMSCSKYGPKLSWNNLSVCYQFFPWHRNECYEQNKKVKVFHIFSDLLPWECDFSKVKYEDIHLWGILFLEMLEKYDFDIKKMNIRYRNSLKDIKKENTFLKFFK